ncbi:UDP-N-acetylmuramoyl-L-alanyl-D-glutamate--2,6-diaminopimelate ligase [Aliidiomarina iranensis]|uniref:UDP-N-acetylmuramoyl-L-alanyl-D-glutamate--2,6-diaminopimelate ligase n=1 Tax=Aliidiomarina iranensis TaxID=1434071 RepID=A0A432W2S9_9GAMM|nr:UDP-N-acetylmuramoyl-L-alanyl-D-glutamate--2,6-diaminopimelate ligase [Aliidiomarina iranensis]RUO23520.1 UDP-N-acetylmuramoyl-L-alanyl-D-glutamate--2,6-diaminopimelate ligase [Aliidiomarina iranensis]
MITLSRLIPDCPMPLPELTISGLKLDSRKIASGDAFIAVPGAATDGREYIDSAIAAGASVVLADMDEWTRGELDGVPLIGIPNLASEISHIAGRFFQQPDSQLRLIGVTGTNGKTTVSHLVAQLWQQLEPSAAVLGTLGSGVLPNLLPETNTTPDAVTVQQRLASFAAEGAKNAAMEVSSHALVQGRVEALHFDTLIATNLTRDHLDYHGSMAEYIAAKARLFSDFPARVRILNADDGVVAAWGTADDYWYSLNRQKIGQKNTLVASEIQYTHAGTSMVLHWQDQQISVLSPLLGDFNVANLLAALLSPLTSGFSLTFAAALVPQLQSVAGRMETFSAEGKPLVLVDYAHTPDALEQVLVAARRHCSGTLWCVFGCGGDRDRGKRPQMGEVAARLADHAVVTDDNPRTEAPEAIIQDIISGMPSGSVYTALPGRAEAVRQTIAKAQQNDVVVCAGKGHETYQIIGTKVQDYDERAWVAEILGGGQ